MPGLHGHLRVCRAGSETPPNCLLDPRGYGLAATRLTVRGWQRGVWLIDWLIDNHLHSAILRSLEQTHCARLWFYMSDKLFIARFLNIHQSGVLTALAWLVPHETVAISAQVLCTSYNHAPGHFMQSHIRKMYACLAVTCHLHFWQNDRDLLRGGTDTEIRHKGLTQRGWQSGVDREGLTKERLTERGWQREADRKGLTERGWVDRVGLTERGWQKGVDREGLIEKSDREGLTERGWQRWVDRNGLKWQRGADRGWQRWVELTERGWQRRVDRRADRNGLKWQRGADRCWQRWVELTERGWQREAYREGPTERGWQTEAVRDGLTERGWQRELAGVDRYRLTKKGWQRGVVSSRVRFR